MTEIEAGPTSEVKRANKDVARRLMNISIGLLMLVFLSFAYQSIHPNLFNPKDAGVDRLPASIRAGSEADYSQDPHHGLIPPIRADIMKQIITEFPATGSPQERAGTLQAFLSTPVPTMTPDRRGPAAFTPTNPLPGPTHSSPVPTSTAIKTTFATRLPTATGYPTPTATVIPPSATATGYPTPTPIVIPPSATPTLPLATVTPTPTPATMTPTRRPTLVKPTIAPRPTQQPKPTLKPKPTREPRPTKKSK